MDCPNGPEHLDTPDCYVQAPALEEALRGAGFDMEGTTVTVQVGGPSVAVGSQMTRGAADLRFFGRNRFVVQVGSLLQLPS